MYPCNHKECKKAFQFYWSHVTKKNTHTAIYHIFCFVFLIISHIHSHWSHVFGSSVTVGSSVVVATCIAHETGFVADEVGTVVKAVVTAAAQAVLVQVVLLRALFFRQFEAGSVLLFDGSCYGSSSGSSSPVVGSKGSCRHCSFVRLSLSEETTIWTNVEKVFQFYSADSVNRRIMRKIGKWMVTCQKKHTQAHTFIYSNA